jgi:hypothetical protein
MQIFCQFPVSFGGSNRQGPMKFRNLLCALTRIYDSRHVSVMRMYYARFRGCSNPNFQFSSVKYELLFNQNILLKY